MNQPTDLSTVFAYIEKNQQSFVDRLLDYLRHPSISAYGEGMGEVADYLVDWLNGLGMETRLMPTPGWPLVLGKRIHSEEKLTVLVYGHYDVQPPEPLEAWITPPFEPTIRNGRIYARGAGDNKGQHFAQILAIESLLACFGELPCNVIVLLEGEEETGSPHIEQFIREHKHELPADLVIISDGPVDASGRSRLEFGVRGVLTFELRARGANADLHSGNWGGVAPNPLWTLVHLLGTMKNKNGDITIDGFYDNVDALTEMERKALDNLPIDIEAVKSELELEYFDAPVDRPYYDRLALYPTLTINGLHGGYAGPGPKTVLPHEAIARCDIRLVESQTVDEIFSKVEAHVKRHAPEVVFIRQHGMDPSKTPLDSPFTEPIFRAIATAQGDEPLIVPAMGGSLPNYVFTRIMKLPTFLVPYANFDEANHAPNENIEVERFLKGIKTGAAMLISLGSVK
jgi:acetylornithine deacetylase/succinyl-diaminopimelate desuccinylase-like protein